MRISAVAALVVGAMTITLCGTAIAQTKTTLRIGHVTSLAGDRWAGIIEAEGGRRKALEWRDRGPDLPEQSARRRARDGLAGAAWDPRHGDGRLRHRRRHRADLLHHRAALHLEIARASLESAERADRRQDVRAAGAEGDQGLVMGRLGHARLPYRRLRRRQARRSEGQEDPRYREPALCAHHPRLQRQSGAYGLAGGLLGAAAEDDRRRRDQLPRHGRLQALRGGQEPRRLRSHLDRHCLHDQQEEVRVAFAQAAGRHRPRRPRRPARRCSSTPARPTPMPSR